MNKDSFPTLLWPVQDQTKFNLEPTRELMMPSYTSIFLSGVHISISHTVTPTKSGQCAPVPSLVKKGAYIHRMSISILLGALTYM